MIRFFLSVLGIILRYLHSQKNLWLKLFSHSFQSHVTIIKIVPTHTWQLLKLFSLTRDNQKKRLRHREGTEPIVCLAPASPNYVSVFSSKGSIKTKEIVIESNTLIIIVLLKPVTSPKLSGDHWNDQFWDLEKKSDVKHYNILHTLFAWSVFNMYLFRSSSWQPPV